VLNFPILKRLDVDGFDLFPGSEERPGLHAEFQPGLTLVIGANGLGKSTLVLLLYRMLAGTAEIGGDRGSSVLGSGQLSIRPLRQLEEITFSQRVRDAAANAQAVMEFSLGERTLSVERRLDSMALIAFSVDGVASVSPTEDGYRDAVVEAAGIGQFLDWLLVLRYLVFFFDDRRSLVWDPTAQRRILRLLFMAPSPEDPIGQLETKILQADSRARNVSATLTTEENRMRSQERALDRAPEAKARLEDLVETRTNAEAELEALRSRAADLEGSRAEVRLTLLRARESRESATHQVEQQRMAQLLAAFPTATETAAYLVTKILAEERCAVCESRVPDFATELSARIDRGQCVICGSETSAEEAPAPDESDFAVGRSRLVEASVAEASASELRDRVESELNAAWNRITELDEIISSTSVQMRRLEGQLPEPSRALEKRRDAIRELRLQNNMLKEEVLADKEHLTEMVKELNLEISGFESGVTERFSRYAKDFLLDSCSLVWGANLEQIGQIGRGISYSVFQIDMAGGAVGPESRRNSAEAVSESQREFIDLAFRMALVEVAGVDQTSTLVIDAPESSLDAVFAPRAADVLTDFAQAAADTRVIITSNLVEGRLIPTLASRSGIDGPSHSRIVNLFDIAAPTMALTSLRPPRVGVL
jgi:energy-coupling factor transporter ATP-binding protein EcfA2